MIKINLLPYREERKKELVFQQVIIAAVPLVIILAICTAVWAINNAQVQDTVKEIEQMNKKIAQCTLKMKEINEYKKNKDILEKKMGVITNLQKGKDGPVHMLDELATAIPGNIWLTGISQKGMSLELAGLAMDNIAISNYMQNLEKSPYMSSVDLKTIVDQTAGKSSKTLKKFIITCTVTYTPKKAG